MTSTSRLSLVAVSLALAILIVVGCGTRNESGPAPEKTAVLPASNGSTAATPVPAKDDGPLFANWPKEGFEGALIFSGEQIGYLEPCGCTSGQRGGLARRLDLVNRLKAQGWDLALIDLGSLINDPNSLGGPIETRIRYTYALKALDILGYRALGLSPLDLKLGVGEVLTQYMNYLGPALKVVAANVSPAPGLGLDEAVVPSTRVQVGGVKIGVTTVVEPAMLDALQDPDKDLMLNSRDPSEVLPGLLAEMERETQIQVLMVQGSPEYGRKIAEAQPGFEVVVTTSQFVEPPAEPELLHNGKTRLVTVGKKGQYVGVLGLYNTPEEPYRYYRVDLNLRYDSKTEAMRKLIDEDFQEALKQADVLASYPRRAYVFANNTPADATFVGAETCKSCHPKTYEQWAGTRHAHAYEALTMDPKRVRTSDAHCITCHTVGFEYKGGFTNAVETAQLKGVQCENCHGPASQHVMDPGNAIHRESLHRTRADWEKNHRCVDCHTEDDSPHFDFATYWPKVLHSGLDSYNDPKVYEGLKPHQLAAESTPAH